MAHDTSATWCEPAAPSQRAEWAALLAQAHIDGLTPAEQRGEIDDVLISIAADPAVSVRRALAITIAGAETVPPGLIRLLSRDSDSVAAPVIRSSPHLSDEDLIERFSSERPKLREAILARQTLSERVTGAIIPMADFNEVRVLLDHQGAMFSGQTLRRIAEAHGDDASLRGALVERSDLPADLRQYLMLKTSEAVASSPLVALALGERRGRTIGTEACQRGTATILGSAQKSELTPLIDRLVAAEQLSPAVMLRLACSGSLEGLSESLSRLSGVKPVRVRSILVEGRHKPFAALCERAGLPSACVAILFHAVAVWRNADEDGEMLTDGEVAARIMQRMASELGKGDADTMAPALAFLRGLSREAGVRRPSSSPSTDVVAA
ncbi:DUF2336 domain-containing protein [Fulvimarina sp. MAC3]|uniref:DUF2336 domain-containing protein n=1 Tax=Fulvimarina sp. MAC3 TaxID=3148887 RepID=UPI0031FBC164